ncbi:Piwi domain-containing protein [Halteromyces radiatus]|uniref:Piwi domain-containing protein n=1 Tax=Halteromyces radiatus TaxID=101107 RepID=UPI002220441B|nr:Piwi domain-containing protein [Halteromyces radiatus]KAI8092854.1 Piwi domain-containing protein [Halteromyces radiatus]
MANISNTNLTQLAMRPNTGMVGRPIHVRSNFFEMTSLPAQNIQHLNIQILPDGTPPAVLRKVWQSFEDSLEGQAFLNKVKPVFDGRANLFSPKPLKCGDNNLGISFEVNLQEGNRSGGVFKLNIKPVGVINMRELQSFLDGRSGITNNCLAAIMALDVLFHHIPSMQYPTVDRSFFTPQDKRPLPNGAEVWQGIYQSIRPTQGKMMVNVDVSTATFYESGPLHELLPKLLDRHSLDDLRHGISDSERIEVEKILKNLKIVVVHRGAEKRLKYKINKLTPTSVEDTVFKDKLGNEITVAQYFQKTYNRRFAYPFLPCIVVKKDTFLPMEVCEVLPGQRYTEKLNEKQTAEMTNITSQNPAVRANKINQGVNLLKYKDNPYIQQFGVNVKNDMVMINARVLPAPEISFHPSSQNATFAPSGGAWNLGGKKVAMGANLGSWSVVNFASNVHEGMVQCFIRELCQTFTDTGLNVINRKPPITHANPQGNIERTLKEAWLKAGNAAKAEPQLICCILPNTGVALYGEIIRVSDTVIGIPTQCVQSKHIADAKKQYCANVCLKVNMKLGGANWMLDRSEIPFISSEPAIVFGAEVTHPGPGDMNRPSVAALTASMDPYASRYASTVRVQANRTEVIADLANMVKELLKVFYQRSGLKPQRILFYRDGVSEGQFDQVLKNEVSAIHGACSSLEKYYRPLVTFVVVQKCHRTRFFATRTRDADQSGNCQPGTVVDTDIVHPFEFDFYLQSHAGLQGTSRPTYYHVLYDDNNFSPDALQELTYRLCYTYGRATRAVSICPPAYYADLVAARARFHRKGKNWEDTDTSESMDNDSQMASFAAVKPDLQKLMYFL